MAVNVIKRTWSQDRMVRPETLNGMACQAEAGAHRFEITGYDSNGNVMAFSGSVTAIFLRPDNTDVPLTGVISNGVAQVTLSQECYQVPGRFGLAIFVNSGNTKTVVYKCIGPVGMTSSGVEASSVVQSVNTLIDRIEAAVNSIPQDYSALSKSVSATCPEMRDGSTGNPWNTDSITTKYVIKIDKSCDELILEYIGSTQAQYYVFGYSVFNGVADGTESYAARTSAASFLDYPEKYVQTEPYVIIPVSQLGDYTHIAIVLWAKSDETTFIPLRIATEQNNLRVTFRHASYMGHEEINNRSVKVGVQNASKMASPLKLVHFSDLHRDVNALNRIRASAKYVCPNADNIICTGDMVANTYAEITSWWIPEIMTCIGNHDTASYDGTYDWTALTMAQRDEMYISPFKAYWGIVHTAGTSYYYKDYTAAHIRLIVMDAMLYSGTPGAEATAQTQWLANLLASAITDSLHVIIAIHAPHGGSVPVACSFTKLGQETMPVNVDCNTPDVVINTVATAIGNGLHFIGYICGHTHQDAVWDCTGDRSQLMYTVTCAAVDQTAQWIDSDQYRTDEQDAFNVLTIDTASTTIKILRGGGANTDVALRPRVSMVINYSTGKIITDTYASGTQDAVVYGEAQELTDAQKAQARANIGAGSAADVSENTADITANANEITSLKSALNEYLPIESDRVPVITAGTDIDTLTTAGVYRVLTAAAAAELNGTLPITNRGYMLIVIETTQNNRVWQICLINGYSPLMARNYLSTGWTQWVTYATQSYVDGLIANVQSSVDANTENILKTLSLATDNAQIIESGTDVDTLVTAGNYIIPTYAVSQTISNIPEKIASRIFVLHTINSARIMQIFLSSSAYANIYLRFNDGSSWNSWHHIVNDFEQFRNSKNLLPKGHKETSFYNCDVVYDNGCIDLNGTASTSGGAQNAITDGFVLKAGTYTMSLTYGSTKKMRVWLKDAEGNNLANVNDIYNPVTFKISSAKTGCRLGVQLVSGSVYDHNTVYVQIEQSEYQTAFELPTFQTAIDAVCRNSISNILSAFTNIECVGDSLTWGAVYTSDTVYRQSYKPYPVILGHITGATVSSVATPGFNPTEWWNEYQSQIAPKINALAIIFLGTNGGLTDTLDTDVSGDDPTLWANTHTGNYARIVNAYISSGYKVLLVKCFKTSGDINITNSVIQQIADRFKCGIVDNEYMPGIAYHDTPDRTYSNTLHYNDFGYAAMAYQIAKNVEAMSETHKTYMIQA